MDSLIPFDSVLLADVVSTPEMRSIWSETNLLRTWMEVERAVTETQADLGLIPRDAATQIIETLDAGTLSAAAIRDEARRSGHLFVGFLRAFRTACGPAAEHFHVGPTTQDILDTGLTLQMREAHRLVMVSLLDLEELLCRRANAHKGVRMMGRTHEQHALPYTFGLVLAGWASEVRDHIERAKEAETRWLLGSLSGGVGTHSAFVELSDAPTARRLEAGVCERLGLRPPAMHIQTRIDRFVEVVLHLAMSVSTLGRIGLQLRTMERPEVAELEQTYGPDSCFSSTMPNKLNPEPAERVEGLAHLVRGHAVALLSVRMADHRDSTRLPVLYTAIPGAYAMAHCALRTITGCIQDARVREDRMLANLDHPELLGQAAAERLMIALYRKTGRKHEAHTVLSRCCHVSRQSRRPLREVVLEDPTLRAHLTAEVLDALMDLRSYVGTAELQVEETVQALLARNAEDRQRYPVDTGRLPSQGSSAGSGESLLV